MSDFENVSEVRKLGLRYSIFRLLLWLFLGMMVLDVVLAYSIYGDLSNIPDFGLKFLDSISMWAIEDDTWFMSIPTIVISMACYIAYGFFFQRAMYNTWKQDIEDVTVQPFATWAWHFVPIASFFMPFRGVAQVYRGSLNPQETDKTGISLLRYWWAFWLIISMLDVLEEYVVGISNLVSMKFYIIVSMANIITAIFLLEIIKRIYEGQRKNFY